MLHDIYSEDMHATIKHKPYVKKLDLFLIQVIAYTFSN